MSTSSLRYWLAAVHMRGVGPRKVQRWLERFVEIHQVFDASPAALRASGCSELEIQMLQSPDWQAVEKDLAWAKQPRCHLISLMDPAYPELLRHIANPPLVLYVWGNKEVLMQPQIGMVGSRHPTLSGRKTAEQFAHCLAKAGLTITSGLALGIDGASHRGALAAEGKTIGVSGTGLQHIYPSSHHKLAEEMVAREGAVISEFPLSTAPKAENFPRRNRIISGLSLGVLVVEAALQSGSLITARHALEQNREVFAIPGSIHHPLARGCHSLIRQGAKLVETAEDVLEELGLFRLTPPPTRAQSSVPTEKLAPDYQQLLEKIDYEATALDVILLRSGLTASEVSSMLLTLELGGHIQTVSGGYVRAI